PHVDGLPFGRPACPELVDRQQRLELGLGLLAGLLEPVAPSLRRPEGGGEDRAERAPADDVGAGPDARVDIVEDAEDAFGGVSVVPEQEADLVGVHASLRWSAAGA